MGYKDPPKEFQWKKGVSGNPKGRKKGTSLKEYARKYFENMTEEERNEYLETVDPDLVWKMAEGNPAQDSKIEATVKLPQPIMKVK